MLTSVIFHSIVEFFTYHAIQLIIQQAWIIRISGLASFRFAKELKGGFNVENVFVGDLSRRNLAYFQKEFVFRELSIMKDEKGLLQLR